MAKTNLPDWAQSMREIFRSETISQFILTGNVHDLIPCSKNNKVKFYSLKEYLNHVLFVPFETIIFYDRGKGIHLKKGADQFYQFLKILDKYHGTKFSGNFSTANAIGNDHHFGDLSLQKPGQILDLIDRFMLAVSNAQDKNSRYFPKSAAVVINYAHYIIPKGESLHLSGDMGANLVKILDWAENPAITGANIVTVLISDTISDLNDAIVNSPHTAKIEIPLPRHDEICVYLKELIQEDTKKYFKLTEDQLADRLVGLNLVNIKNVIFRAVKNDKEITSEYLTQSRKTLIEKEAFGKLEFIETSRTLDDIAGHAKAKQWLKNDADLIKRNIRHALPMGYLITGRIGTGKSYLVECFAGECGIPCVVMKNFREKWVGATEKNLEKIFQILHAFGQVVVFIDEADQIAGRRMSGSSDSGISGRIYGMLAQEMAKTDNRGRIMWILATSRPDLLEVDIKRQGRLDVHIPLFPAADKKSQIEMLVAIAKKLHVDLDVSKLNDIHFEEGITGSQIEGLLVRTIREYELQTDKKSSFTAILKKMIDEFRPMSNTKQMELMDLLAVKECTDVRFLPEKYRNMDIDDVQNHIENI